MHHGHRTQIVTLDEIEPKSLTDKRGQPLRIKKKIGFILKNSEEIKKELNKLLVNISYYSTTF